MEYDTSQEWKYFTADTSVGIEEIKTCLLYFKNKKLDWATAEKTVLHENGAANMSKIRITYCRRQDLKDKQNAFSASKIAVTEIYINIETDTKKE